jgi:ribosomal protein S18 acetylase RimI-like enzyme
MIRIAQLSDAAAIAEVQVAAWHAAYRGLIPDAMLDAFTVEVRRAKWKQNLSTVDPGEPRTTVLERSGRLLGFASVGRSRHEPGSGEVWALYVHPDAWSTGAGRALLDHGLVYLGDAGFERVMLRVLPENARAIRFYQQAGFRLDGAGGEEAGLPHLRMVRP